MDRKVEKMKPRRMSEFKRGKAIEDFASVLEPSESEPPILIPTVRQSVFQWMTELNCAEELVSAGIKPRRKLIFFGPPGCGKTTLAHHLSARMGVPLILINMQTVVSCYLGQTGNNIDAIFKDLAAQENDCVLFLDEFDSIAEKRATTDQGALRERNSIVVALLQKMDAYDGTMIAATNRSDDIDAAIWRRFEMHIEIGLPDAECRFAIIRRYLAPFEIDDDAISAIASASGGATPAMLRQLSESIKRDIILAPRLRYDDGAVAILRRAVATTMPHADSAVPSLWGKPEKTAALLEKHWPPRLSTATPTINKEERKED